MKEPKLYNTFVVLNGIIFVLALFPGVGPQNLNTMSHGIKKNHAYTVALTCFICDGALIILGGAGLKLSNSNTVIIIINCIGILFISIYLFIKIKSLFNVHKTYKISNEHDTLKISIMRALLLTWLNPLVFIDTIVVVGGAASHYVDLNWYLFMVGTIIGDFIWQFGLVYISGKLSHTLNQIKVWVTLDIFTVCILSYVLYKTIVLVMN